MQGVGRVAGNCRAESPKAHSPGQCPGSGLCEVVRSERAKAFLCRRKCIPAPLQMYFFTVLNVFLHHAKCISSPCQMYSCTDAIVFASCQSICKDMFLLFQRAQLLGGVPLCRVSLRLPCTMRFGAFSRSRLGALSSAGIGSHSFLLAKRLPNGKFRIYLQMSRAFAVTLCLLRVPFFFGGT